MYFLKDVHDFCEICRNISQFFMDWIKSWAKMKSFNGNVTIVSARKMWPVPKIHAEKPFVFEQNKSFLRAAPQIRFFPPDFLCTSPIFSHSLSKLIKQLHFYQLLSPPQGQLHFTGGRSNFYIQSHLQSFAIACDVGAAPPCKLRTARAGFQHAFILQ